MPHELSIFGKEIPLYGIFFFLGIIIAGTVSIIPMKKRKIPCMDWVSAAAFAMIGAIIGSKLLFIIVSIKQIIELNLSIYAVIKGGFVFYGGLIGGIIGILIYTKKYKLPTIDYFDVAAVVVPLGHAFGRVGCFFGGCCYGMPYSGKFAVVYTQTDGMTPLNQPLFPIQLLEAILLLLTFFCLFIVFIKKPNKRGMPTFLYTIVYSLMRFSLEFLRGDKERGIMGFLSTSQIISISILIASITIFIFIKKKRPKL